MKAIFDEYRLLFVVFSVIAITAIFYSVGNHKINESILKEEGRIKTLETVLDKTPLKARAVSVYDLDNHIEIYGRNSEEALPIASLAKILTVAMALDKYYPKSVVTIDKEALDQNGDFGLFLNEEWRAYDLAQFVLIASANDGAHALASGDFSFLESLNDKAKRIGMQQANFQNFTGLDFEGTAQAVASARDVNIMAGYAYKKYPLIYGTTILPETKLTSLSGFVHEVKNTDIIVDRIPDILFSKTGYTEIAGGGLCVIFKDKSGRMLAVTVLGSTFTERFTDMEQIVNILYSY